MTGLLAALFAVVAAGVHLSRVGWGLDRSDEGQYLLLLEQPEASRFTVFLHGYLLHPLYVALGGDVALLRAAGILGCVAVCAALGVVAARAAALGRGETTLAAVVCGAFGIGASLFFPLTPSYNTVAFWGVGLWAVGAVLLLGPGQEGASRRGGSGSTGEVVGRTPLASRGGQVGAALLGVGGVVAATGKVTSAAALAALTVILVGLVVAPTGDRRRRCGASLLWLVVGALASLLVLMALVGHGPVWFVRFYADGIRSVDLLQGHESLVRFRPVARDAVVSPATACLVAGGAVLFLARRTAWLVVGGVLLLAGVAAGFRSGLDTPDAVAGLWWVLVIALAGAAGRAPGGARPSTSPVSTLAARRWWAAAALAVAPAAYAVGTNGNLWVALPRVAVFWVAAGLIVAASTRARRALLATASALLLAVTAMSLDFAYRYPPPGDGVSAVVDAEGARLTLTPQDAATSARLLEVSRQHGLAGVPILDVSGDSPGYIHQLGGVPVGSTWLLGGYPGSLDAALHAVRAADPADVRRAWVLDAPDSRRRIPGLLPALGLDADRDYEVVTTFPTQLGHDVRLLRPRG